MLPAGSAATHAAAAAHAAGAQALAPSQHEHCCKGVHNLSLLSSLQPRARVRVRVRGCRYLWGWSLGLAFL